ncbi:hypothetical protein DFH28DRAFT_930752 [Melampsora americana]|nr:hypothetical protein DFH28DRAFT_930752 [Melampsora americana]
MIQPSSDSQQSVSTSTSIQIPPPPTKQKRWIVVDNSDNESRGTQKKIVRTKRKPHKKLKATTVTGKTVTEVRYFIVYSTVLVSTKTGNSGSKCDQPRCSCSRF